MKFYPSRAHRWVGGGCTASVAAEAAAYRAPDGKWADEGNRLHHIAAGLLRGNTDTTTPEDQKEIAAYVQDVKMTAVFGGDLHIEQRVRHPDFPNATDIDARVSTDTREILWDYKSGFRSVEVVENWQLIVSAIMLDIQHKEIEFRIVQPNGWHPDGVVRSWVVPDLEPYRVRVYAAMQEAREAPKFVASPANCTYCKAVTACPAARAVTLGAMDLAMKFPGKLPADAIRSELVTLRTASKILATRLDALEVEAEARMRAGEAITGCAMRASKAGSRKWVADEAQIKNTLATMGIPAIKETILTPTQVIEAGCPESLVDKLAKRTNAKMSVDTDSHERTAKRFKNV